MINKAQQLDRILFHIDQVNGSLRFQTSRDVWNKMDEKISILQINQNISYKTHCLFEGNENEKLPA